MLEQRDYKNYKELCKAMNFRTKNYKYGVV